MVIAPQNHIDTGLRGLNFEYSLLPERFTPLRVDSLFHFPSVVLLHMEDVVVLHKSFPFLSTIDDSIDI